jgi:DNA-binding protein H-NS
MHKLDLLSPIVELVRTERDVAKEEGEEIRRKLEEDVERLDSFRSEILDEPITEENISDHYYWLYYMHVMNWLRAKASGEDI